MNYAVILKNVGLGFKLQVGAKLHRTVTLHNGKLGFEPEDVFLVEKVDENDDDYYVFELSNRAHSGVALFFPEDSSKLAEGEEWAVEITSQRESSNSDRRGRKMILHQVKPIARTTRETEPRFIEATNMWVSEVRSGTTVVERSEIPGSVRRVRYAERYNSNASLAYDEYFMEIAGEEVLVTRKRVAGSYLNEVADAERRKERLGALARKLPSLSNVTVYPPLPADGKTDSTYG